MEYEIIDLIQMIRQRIAYILGGALICSLIVGAVSYFFIPPTYEATATLLVQPQVSDNQLSNENITASEKLVSTYSEIIKSESIAQKVKNELKLNYTVKELLKMVEAKGVKESLVTAITVKAGTAQEAVTIANFFAASFTNSLPVLMKVENISILDPAKLDEEPVSPKPLLYTVITFIVGLNMGAVIVVASSMMDKTIKSEEIAEKLLGIPVLAVVPKVSLKLYLKEGKEELRDEHQPTERKDLLPG